MQLLCESHPRVGRVTDGFHQIVASPLVYPEPIVRGETPVDMYGTSIYGSVIKENGLFRMWYQAWPDDWDQNDTCQVACVESEDGINWRRPDYGVIEYHSDKHNHLTDLPFHCPSVFIDPHASEDSRYKAFGFINVATMQQRYKFHKANHSGYYAAHSGDGLHWTLDSPEPAWPYGDVITSVWDQYADCARVFLKRIAIIGGVGRRCVYEASWKDGVVTPEVSTLLPDEYDDICAHSRGFQSADYYGMGVMPTPGPTIGFLWNFRHMSPLVGGFANMGRVDLSLVYQSESGAKWRHVYGRPDWLCAENAPEWARGALYTSSSPIDVKDETWLYFTGTRDRHGWTGVDRGYMEYLDTLKGQGGFAQIGVLKWQKDRLMGYSTSLRDRIEFHTGRLGFKGEFSVNVKTQESGSVHARVLNGAGAVVGGYDFNDCDSFSGDFIQHTITWHGKSELPFLPDDYIIVEVEIENGVIYAFDLKSTSE